MKPKEIREMTDPELERLHGELRQERLNLRVQSRTGQLHHSARLRQIRRDVARILTEQNRRGRAATAAPATAAKGK
jgi:large subunit ribosomal protein L29